MEVKSALFNFEDFCESRNLEKQRGCSSAGRAPALQAGGQEFDSPHLHQREKWKEEDRLRDLT